MNVKYIILILLSLICINSSAQFSFEGTVLDKSTGQTVPFAKLTFIQNKRSTLTDLDGAFSIKLTTAKDSLLIHSVGYRDTVVFIDANITPKITLSISEVVLSRDLSAVVVLPPKEFPSTRLFKKIIRHKKENDLFLNEQLSFSQYSQSHINFLMRTKSDSVPDSPDSSSVSFKELPFCVIESNSTVYFQKNPELRKEVVDAYAIKGIERLDIKDYLSTINRGINIYKNSINLFNVSFVSPISSSGLDVYRYYIEDTVYSLGQPQIKMSFKPRKPGDLTFSGYFLVEDSTFAITAINASMNQGANINYVQQFDFNQQFRLNAAKQWAISEEDTKISFQLVENSKRGKLVVSKKAFRDNYQVNVLMPSEVLAENNPIIYTDGALKRDAAYWEVIRGRYLGDSKLNTYAIIDSMNKTPLYKRVKFYSALFGTGHIKCGMVDVGDFYDAVSYSYVERLRLGLSLRTNKDFAERIQLHTRIYYGLQDNRLKYTAKAKFLLPTKQRSMIRLESYYDLLQLGQAANSHQLGGALNTLFQTVRPKSLTFQNSQRISYERNLFANSSIELSLTHKRLTAEGMLRFQRLNQATNEEQVIPSINTTELGFVYRWAKNEQFIQGQFERISIGSKYPIITIENTFAHKAVIGSDYSYHKLRFTYDHRINTGRFGRLIYRINAGIITGRAPFPLLEVHEGNQSFYFVRNAYNAMNFLEFISDKFISLSVEQHWGGLFLNHFKWNDRVKMRFVSSAKILYGSISKENRSVLLLPKNTLNFNKVPYVEASVGIENIFQVVRLDLLCRFTHTHNPSQLPEFYFRARFDFFL